LLVVFVSLIAMFIRYVEVLIFHYMMPIKIRDLHGLMQKTRGFWCVGFKFTWSEFFYLMWFNLFKEMMVLFCLWIVKNNFSKPINYHTQLIFSSELHVPDFNNKLSSGCTKYESSVHNTHYLKIKSHVSPCLISMFIIHY
jgi:hypothetical protein